MKPSIFELTGVQVRLGWREATGCESPFQDLGAALALITSVLCSAQPLTPAKHNRFE